MNILFHEFFFCRILISMAATSGNVLGDEESQLSFGSSNKIQPTISFTKKQVSIF